MQDLENAVWVVLKAVLTSSRVMDSGLLMALQALEKAFSNHLTKPKHDEWGQYIGDDQAKENAEVERLQGELSADEVAIKLQNERTKTDRLAAALTKAKAENDKLNNHLSGSDTEVAQLRGKVLGLQCQLSQAQSELMDAKKDVERLQVQLEQQKSYTQSLGEDRLRVANERDALRAEVERLQGHLANMRALRNDIYDAAGIAGPPLRSRSAIVISKLRDHEAAMRFKREVSDIAGTGSYNCDEIRDALKAKLSQLTIQARAAAEFRAAWAKLKGMLE